MTQYSIVYQCTREKSQHLVTSTDLHELSHKEWLPTMNPTKYQNNAKHILTTSIL